MVLDHGRGQELLVKEALHIQMTSREKHLNPSKDWLLDFSDEKAGREE